MLTVGGAGEDGHFELQISPGEIPAGCLVHGGGAVSEVWGTSVEAVAYDGERSAVREVTFLHGGYGYRFVIHGADKLAVEDITARTVRFFVLGCAPYFVSDADSEAYTGGEMNTLPYDPTEETAEPTPPPAGE